LFLVRLLREGRGGQQIATGGWDQTVKL
jgi:WD40 repeat protein